MTTAAAGAGEPEESETPEVAPDDRAAPKKKPRACTRCGTFAKRKRVFEERLCADCVEKSLHPAAMGPMLVGDVVTATLRIGSAIAVPALAAWLVPALLSSALGALGAQQGWSAVAIELAGFVIRVLTSPTLCAFTLLLAWRTLRRQPLAPGSALLESLWRWPRMMATSIVAAVSVLAYSLLFLIPGFLRSLDVITAEAIALLEDQTAVIAMEESVRRMKPFRGTVFGGLTALVLVAMLSLVTLILPLGGAGLDAVAVSAWLLPVWSAGLQVLTSTFVVVVYAREQLAPRPDTSAQ